MSAAAIAAAARAWIGTPYRHQASTLGAGCDCLGLVRGVWRAVIGEEPWAVPAYGRYPPPRRGAVSPVECPEDEGTPSLEEAADLWLLPGEEGPGAVLLFRLHRSQPPRHCGIMVSASRFIHAQERLGVVEADLGEAWRRRTAGVFAFPCPEPKSTD